jgi:hypothetical protein
MGQPAFEVPGSVHPNAPPRTIPARPASQFEQAGVAICLLGLTLFTTLSTGAVLMYNFLHGAPPFAVNADFFPFTWVVRHPDRLSGGWPFALTLLGILFAHEIGHYVACRVHGVRSSLPWVLPAPTLIGTFGAFIRLRSRVPTRIALLDIGIAGPLAGMVIAIPALVSGLLLSQHEAAPGFQSSASISVSVPLALSILSAVVHLFHPALPPLDASFNPHPVLVAAWIGLFITSVNLMPAGQLDGGHILYAVSPRLHRFATGASVFLLDRMARLGMLPAAQPAASSGAGDACTHQVAPLAGGRRPGAFCPDIYARALRRWQPDELPALVSLASLDILLFDNHEV